MTPVQDLVLVTAASGKQATALLPHLVKQGKQLRLQCVSAKSKARLEAQYPQAEVMQTTFDSLEKATALLDGVKACYLVTPAFHPRETQMGINMIDAAVRLTRSGQDFRHMVLASVLHSSLRSLANHDNKRLVEEALIESGLPWTILQPTHVMDNVPVRAMVQQEDPVFPARFDPEIKFSFLSCHDLGEATANIMADRDKHLYATYPLVSTAAPLNYHEAMDIVSSVSGKPIRIERVSLETIVRGYIKSTVSEDSPQEDVKVVGRGMARLMTYYDTQGLLGNSKVLEMILGRKPLSYREWVEMQLK